MQGNEKPLHSQKITVEIVARLTVKLLIEVVEDPSLKARIVKQDPAWKVSMTSDSDPEFVFENADPGRHRGDVFRDYDADAVAKEFLNLKSPDAALTFFKKYIFDESKVRVRWSEVESIRKTFLSALANEPVPQDLQKDIFQPLQVQLMHDVKAVQVISKKPVKKEEFDAVVGIAECRDVLSSLRAVTFLSRGAGWRKCANPKCEMFFKPGRPDQIYHDQACTRKAIANRFNERTRKAKTKRRRK